MSRSTRRPPVTARRPLAAAALAGLVLACATSPLEKRDWFAVETEHYAIWSALDEDPTRELAAELERFRAAAEFVWGSPIAPAPVRTRVYAFDDRGYVPRLTAAGERSYLLTSLRGDRIVLRTGDGWSGDTRVPLVLAYARRLFWNSTADPLPAWYEEGLPQLASTLEVSGDGAQVGIPRLDHVKTLRRSLWIPFERLLFASDLGPWSERELELFEAESWALVHYLKIGVEPRSEAPERLHALITRAAAADAAQREEIGQDLQRAVWHHISARELASLTIAIPPRDAAPAALRPVPKHEVQAVLGTIALAVGQDDRARRYFEQALAAEPGSVAALLGLGRVSATAGDTSEAEARFAEARSRAPDDPVALLDLAQLSLDRARASDDSAARARAAAAARDLYRSCVALAPRIPEGHAGLAESELSLGDPAAAAMALADARRLLPGDPSIGALAVRVALARGEDAEARREAVQLGTRARGAAEREAAQALLDRVETRAALR